MHTCDYCKNEFSQKVSLNRHQRTARFCMEIRKNLGQTVDTSVFLTCEQCDTEFTEKKSLVNHQKICKKKEKVDQKPEDKPVINITFNTNNSTVTNSNNTVNSMITYMSVERVQEAFKDFDVKKLLDMTQRQLATIVHERLLSIPNQPASYICKDRSRNKFYYIDENNKETEDPNATVHRTLVSNGLAPINKDIYRKERLALGRKLIKAIEDEDSNLAKAYHEDIRKLNESHEELDIIKDGTEYISQLAKILPSSYDHQVPSVVVLDKDKDDYDEKYFQLLLRQIGHTMIDDLMPYRDEYRKTCVMNGPAYLMDPTNRHSKEYLWFLQVNEERLIKHYVK